MRVAVINEVSARDKNPYIIEALKKQPVKVFNAGMKQGEYETELTYIHTGFMAALLLNLGAVDMVIGGCGTGQGFLLSAMQYPNVFCGLITEPLDAWLFGQINGGNCISLALNKGFGWAGNINLEYIFEKLFSDEFGRGYPVERQLSQQQSRKTLQRISQKAHKPFAEIFAQTDKEIISTVFKHKPFTDLVVGESKNKDLKKLILSEN
ncbi:MAG: ribose-5-phosphate isomerase [Clostridiales bacterium]|nr:ribose-5-phosphate isomerase [Clostridiales bacterium]